MPWLLHARRLEFTHDKNSNSCWRIKENAGTSSRGGQTTCIKTRSANPVVGSAEDKARQAEIANGNYIKTPINTDECPEGSVVIDDVDRCRAAAKKLGMKFNEPVYKPEQLDTRRISWETSPKGCLFDKSRGVFLNEEYTTSKHPTQARICEKGGRAPLSWWAAEEPDTDHECSDDCRAWWRGDGRCDVGCNVASCNFDDGDCGAGCKYHCPGSAAYAAAETEVGSCYSKCKRDGGSQDHCTWYCGYNSDASVAMHAAPESEMPLAVTAFAVFGFVVTVYGAFKHFTK